MPTEEVFETICKWLAKLTKKKSDTSKDKTPPTQNMNNTKNIKTCTTSPSNENTIKDEANIKKAWLNTVKEEQKKAGLGNSYGYEDFNIPLHNYKEVLDYSKFRERLIAESKQKTTSKTEEFNTYETQKTTETVYEH